MLQSVNILIQNSGGNMGTTQPIKNKKDLHEFIQYYKEKEPSIRNYTLIVLGINTALRISDILNLKWENVYDFELNSLKNHICLKEHKTGKHTMIAINSSVISALNDFYLERKPNSSDYIFTKNSDFDSPICRSQAYRIVKKAADSMHMENISCHSMRKTFGYHAWKQGIPPVLLMDIYNHSSYSVTKHYLGISQDEKDSVFLEINL